MCVPVQTVTVGIKVLMLLQGRALISSQQLSMGSLLSFVLYQKDMATNMKVKHITYMQITAVRELPPKKQQ